MNSELNLWMVFPSAFHVGDSGSLPGSERLPGEGNGNPLQYSCLENPMDRGAWWATVRGVAKSWTQLSDFHFHFHSPPNLPPIQAGTLHWAEFHTVGLCWLSILNRAVCS